MDPLTEQLSKIEGRAWASGFGMNSEWQVGRLLAALAASKPGGHMLEMGTGAGVGAAWLLSGMDDGAALTTVDTNGEIQTIARDVLGHDPRVTFVLQDGAAFLGDVAPESVDLLFADAWPGKFSHLDEALGALKPGGIYVADDLLPQGNWPDGHQVSVDGYLADIASRPGLSVSRMDWSTGVLVLVKRA